MTTLQNLSHALHITPFYPMEASEYGSTSTSPPPSPKPPTFAVDPLFDGGSSTGDCILRSSDGFDFKIHRAILCLASSVFDDMFSLPQPHGSRASPKRLPEIDMAEDGETLQSLLLYLYPTTIPFIDTLDLALKVVQAAEKYMISIRKLDLTELLTSPGVLSNDAIRAYALAWRIGSAKLATQISRYTHRSDLARHDVKRDLLQIARSADAILALYELRLRRKDALDTLAGNFMVLPKLQCAGCRQYPPLALLHTKFFKEVVTGILTEPHPSKPELTALARRVLNVCPQCVGCVEAGVREATSTAQGATLVKQFFLLWDTFPAEIQWGDTGPH